MSKQYKMRWRESDIKELERVIKNFNAKLYRITKKNPTATEYLPSRLNKQEVIDSIYSRRDYNRRITDFKAFSKRGAEDFANVGGKPATKWLSELWAKHQRIRNQQRAIRRKELEESPVYSRGRDTGVKRKEMGRIKENAVKTSKLDPKKMHKKEFEKAWAALEREISDKNRLAKMELYKANYLKAMIHEGYPQDLYEFVASLPADLIADTLDIDTEATIDFVYSKAELEQRAQALWEVWESAVQRRLRNDG